VLLAYIFITEINTYIKITK